MTHSHCSGIDRRWPIGPHLSDFADGAPRRGWVNYKLAAADWYIDTLEAVVRQVGFDRHMGVEMALDGILASLCGAFDAASAAVIQASEAYLQSKPTEPHQYGPALVRRRLNGLKSEGMGGDVAGTLKRLTSALQREPAAMGWLMELQRLRNQPMHEITASRHFDPDATGAADCLLAVNGRTEEPLAYFRASREAIQSLAEELLDIADRVAPNGIPSLRPLRRPKPETS